MKWILILAMVRGGVIQVPMDSLEACQAAQDSLSNSRGLRFGTPDSYTYCLNVATGEVKK